MGLLSVIRLANDYNKAKKALKTKKVDVDRVKKLIEKVKSYLEWLEDFKVEIEGYIAKAKAIIEGLQEKLKGETR